MLPLTQDTVARVASGLPAEVRTRLEEGAARFEELPMPDPREEDWRYVELGVDLADTGLPEGPGDAMDADDVIGPALGAAGVTVTEVQYSRFEFRHVDVMGSGRFFYASKPIAASVLLKRPK